MEKMFKRSVLGAAVAFAAVSGSANAAIELAGEAVQMYGQAAGNITIASPDAGDKSVIADLESRIGFRGTVAFDSFGPDLVWQIESGNANSAGQGVLGMRDTFVGLNFDGVGSIKYGRQLVAAYNYVDWPHSNPGIGTVFDWNNDIGAAYEDRADNVIRFDSANFGGVNFQATLSNMGTSTDQMATSIAGSYSQDMFTVHAGYYGKAKYDISPTEKGGDVSYFIVGGAVYLGDVTLTAAYKDMENNLDNLSQNAFSATAQYVLDGTYVFKLGYAGTSDTEGRVAKVADGDTAITGRLGYLLPSTYLYFDVRNYDKASYDTATSTLTDNKGTNFLIGAEYYF